MNFASSFGQTFFISIFAGKIQAEYGLSHGDWGGLYATATTASALVMVWAGTLTDSVRVRIHGPAALIFLALACVGMSVSGHWIGLVAVIFCLRFFGQGMLSHIGMVAMARWYVLQRGKAIAIAALGYAVGESTLPILFVSFMDEVDWRALWIVAAIMLLILVPFIRRFLRMERTPQSEAEREDAFGMSGRHWTRIDALKNPLFWFVVPAIVGPSAWLTALFFQQVHLAETKGWEHAQIVALFPAYTVAAIGASLIAGWALDRFGTGPLLPFSQLPISAGFVTIWATDGLFGAFIGFVLIGLSQGTYSTLFAAFWAEFYGTRFLGGIKSMAVGFMVLGSAIGPLVTGNAIDLGFSFPTQLPWIAAYFLGSSGLLWMGVFRARRSFSAST